MTTLVSGARAFVSAYRVRPAVVVAEDGGRVVAWGSPARRLSPRRRFLAPRRTQPSRQGRGEEQGLLDGRWVDTIVMEKLL